MQSIPTTSTKNDIFQPYETLLKLRKQANYNNDDASNTNEIGESIVLLYYHNPSFLFVRYKTKCPLIILQRRF